MCAVASSARGAVAQELRETSYEERVARSERQNSPYPETRSSLLALVAEVIRQIILETLGFRIFPVPLLGQAVSGQLFQALVGVVAALPGEEVVPMGQGLVHGELEETLLAAFQFVENPGRWGGVRVVHLSCWRARASL